MRVRLFAAFAGATLLLAGCGGTEEDPAMGDTSGPVTSTASAEPGATTDDDVQATGDCSSITEEEVATFAIMAQMFAQVRTVDAMQGMTALGYTPEDMAALLDKFEVAKGVEGEVYGKPDAALVVFRSANDTYAAVVAKGESATDADFAPLNDLEPDVASWIKAQASILDALNQACPDLGS